MWRVLATTLLLFGGGLPTLHPQPPPDQRLVVQRPDVVWIPGDWFLRGSDEEDIDFAVELCRAGEGEGLPGGCPAELFIVEAPQERIWISTYGIDRTEVTHAAWRRCVAANACPPSRVNAANEVAARRLGLPAHPVSGVTWDEARTFCEWVGGRLPTEAEWERAARGHDGRHFPWGNVYNPRLANHGGPAHDPRLLRFGRPDGQDGFRYAAPVGSYPDAVSPYGLVDMAGNVWEWTADLYDPEAYIDAVRVDPQGAREGGQRVVRGGSWFEPAFALRTTHRAAVAQGDAAPDLGFRCAYDP